MAIELVGAAITSRAGATSGTQSIDLTSALSGGLGGSLAEGDVVLAFSAIGTTLQPTLSITDGSTDYTLIDTQQYVVGATYDTVLRVAYKRMGATPDTTVVFGPSGGTSRAQTMGVMVWRGVDPDTLLDVAVQIATATANSRPNPAAITPSTTGAVVVVVGAAGLKTGTNFASADLTDFRTIWQADNQDSILGFGYHDWTSGAFDGAQWTGPTTTNASNAVMSLALRPASASVDADVTPGAGSATGQGFAPSVGTGAAEATANLLTSGQTTTDIGSPFELTTASITVTAGRPVLVFVAASYVGSNDPFTDISVSGASQSWSKVSGGPVPASPAYDAWHVWKSDAASGGSGALTITYPEEVDATAYAVVEIEPSAGAEASIGAADISADGGTSTSISDSIAAVGSSDYQIAATFLSNVSTPPTLSNISPRAGWSEVADVRALDAYYLAALEVQLSPQGGDTTASSSWDQTMEASRIVTIPITVTGGASGDATAEPGAGAASGAGAAPTVSAGASATPGAGSAPGQGAAPSVTAGQDAAVTPGTGAAAGTGQAPDLSAGSSAAPGAGSADGQGAAPTVTAGAGATVEPGAGAAGGAGAAPDVSAGASAAPGAGSATGQGSAPDVSAGGGASVTPGTGAADGAGSAPSVSADATVAPGAGSATGQGAAPTVTADGNTVVLPGAGSVSGAGAAPDVSADATVAPGAGDAAGAGSQPDVGAGATAAAGAGSVAGSGAAPDVSAGATVEPGAGAAAGAGDAPSVTASSAATRGAYATVRIGLRDLSEPVRVVPAYPSAVVRARDHAGAIETRNFADPVRLKAFGG